jgi:hypothetical protein
VDKAELRAKRTQGSLLLHRGGGGGECFHVLQESSELRGHPATTTLPTRFLLIIIITIVQPLVVTCNAMKTKSKMTAMWRASKQCDKKHEICEPKGCTAFSIKQ